MPPYPGKSSKRTQTGSNHQAADAAGCSKMALVKIEASAFLIGEKGFNAKPFGIPVAGFFKQFQVGDQIERLLIACPPPSDGMNWAITRPSKEHFGQADLLARMQ